MTGLPDTRQSRAVLIGVGRYQVLNQLSSVGNNLSALATALQDERIWGLSASNCVVVQDPASATDILDPIAKLASEATDTLLVYYAGHGLIDPRRGELYLALVGSDPERMYTAVWYSLIRDALLESRAKRRIVILDCCYGGRALGLMGSAAETVAIEASAEGTYVLAAAAETKAAAAPPGARFTAFTGELLDIIEHGISGKGPLLDLDSIYRELLAVMQAKGYPRPQKRDRNTAGQLTLIRNQAYMPALAESLELTATAKPVDKPSRTRPGNKRPRVRPVALLTVICTIAAAALITALELGSGSPPSHPTVPITVASALAPVSGDVYVKYLSGLDASAKISGEIKNAVSGEAARLYAQRFPYTTAPAPAGSVTLHSTGQAARYEFQVTPTLATRYQVKLFRSSTATNPLAGSVARMVYVGVTKEIHNYPSCTRPVCHEAITLTTFVPPTAMKTEMPKPWYTYFGLNLSTSSTEPAPPKWADLGAGEPVVTKPKLISADEFDITISFTFQIGNDSYYQHWRTCSKDSEGKDGVGLPGSHGCGGKRILASAPYIG